MPIDTKEPYTPGWWLKTLGTELHNRRVGRSGSRRYNRHSVKPLKIRPGLDLLDAYRRGDPPLREDIHSSWSAPFRQYLKMGRLNFAPKLVRPTANRMGLRAFRTAAANDELGDATAQELMKRNQLKLKARNVHNDMLGLADAYTIVTPPDAKRSWSLITDESPLECITAHSATGETLAGLKMFRDEWDAADWAYLFLPGKLMVASNKGLSLIGGSGLFGISGGWDWVEDKFDDVPGNKVAMVRFHNEMGIGEFEDHLDQLDRINDKIFNEWWSEKIQAFRQRAIERDADVAEDADEPGVDLDDDAMGMWPTLSVDQLAQMFVSSPDALWDLPPGAKMWESAPLDVTPMLNSIQKELQWLASAVDVPLSSLNPDAANQTAEGATNQKEEHLFKVGDRRDRAEAAWAETLAMAFEFQGDTGRADVSKIEVLWGPIELYSLAEKTMSASQAVTTLPLDAIRRDIYQYDPTEIPELRVMDGRSLLFQQPGQPAQPPAGPPAPPAG